MANISDYIKYHECGAISPVPKFSVNSTTYLGEFRVVFKQFENLKNLILNISRLMGSFYHKIV